MRGAIRAALSVFLLRGALDGDSRALLDGRRGRVCHGRLHVDGSQQHPSGHQIQHETSENQHCPCGGQRELKTNNVMVCLLYFFYTLHHIQFSSPYVPVIHGVPHPWGHVVTSVRLFDVGRFCQQNYTTFSEQTSTKLGGEDWSQPGIDPVNFWCRTFFEILLLISQGIMHGS